MKELIWTGNNHREMWMFLTGLMLGDPMSTDGNNFTIDFSRGWGGLVIKTPVGEVFCDIGLKVYKTDAGYFVAPYDK